MIGGFYRGSGTIVMSRHITHGGNALIDHLEQHGFWD